MVLGRVCRRMGRVSLVEISHASHAAVENMCTAVAVRVVRRPLFTLCASAVLTAICATGFLSMRMESLSEKLWVPQNTRAFRDRTFLETRFGYEPATSACYVESKGGNLLTREALRSLFTLHEKIVAIAREDGERGYDERSCFVRNGGDGACEKDGVLAFWDFDRAVFEADDDFLGTLNDPAVPHNFYYEEFVKLKNVAAGFTLDANGTVVGATQFRITYGLRQRIHAKTRRDPHVLLLEKKFSRVAARSLASLFQNGRSEFSLSLSLSLSIQPHQTPEST